VYGVQQAVLAVGAADVAQPYPHRRQAVPVLTLRQGVPTVGSAEDPHETTAQHRDGQSAAERRRGSGLHGRCGSFYYFITRGRPFGIVVALIVARTKLLNIEPS